MERHTERINGLPARLHNYSDAELEANVGFAVERRAAAQHDIDTLMGEQASRFNNLELAVGMATVHHFQTPSVIENPVPPAA